MQYGIGRYATAGRHSSYLLQIVGHKLLLEVLLDEAFRTRFFTLFFLHHLLVEEGIGSYYAG